MIASFIQHLLPLGTTHLLGTSENTKKEKTSLSYGHFPKGTHNTVDPIDT